MGFHLPLPSGVAMPLMGLSMVPRWPMTVSVAMSWWETRCWRVERQGTGEHLLVVQVSKTFNIMLNRTLTLVYLLPCIIWHMWGYVATTNNSLTAAMFAISEQIAVALWYHGFFGTGSDNLETQGPVDLSIVRQLLNQPLQTKLQANICSIFAVYKRISLYNPVWLCYVNDWSMWKWHIVHRSTWNMRFKKKSAAALLL